MPKVLLITSGQPSLNPRLVKEADALFDEGFEVMVIYQYWDQCGTDLDNKLLPNKKWKAILVGSTPKINRLSYWITRLRHKLYTILSSNISLRYNLAENAISRSNHLLLKSALKINVDLYIAHNLAALPIAVNAAKKNNAKCGFDAEDFHRNEVTDNPNDYDVKLKSFLEDKYLKEVDYLTAASPLIARAYINLYPNLNPIVINNVFEIKYQPALNLNSKGALKLFWFSQTIGKNRGLEDVIEALNIINNPLIELHLLGNLADDDESYFNHLAKFKIQYYKPISGDEIFDFAAQFDIGLALELNKPLNRDICLTNKIFTYLISGLAIIASNTAAQQQFLEENESIGKLYPIGNVTELIKIILQLLNDKDLLNEYKNNAYQLAKSKYNWEIESEKFINIVEKTLNN